MASPEQDSIWNDDLPWDSRPIEQEPEEGLVVLTVLPEFEEKNKELNQKKWLSPDWS